jgi:hypothetical protein
MTGYDGPIKNTDLLNLREYVTADTGSLNKADSTVLLMVTHSNLKARFMEIRFDRYVRAAFPRAAVRPFPRRSRNRLLRSRIWRFPNLPVPSFFVSSPFSRDDSTLVLPELLTPVPP